MEKKQYQKQKLAAYEDLAESSRGKRLER